MTSDSIPTELITEIMSRLPTKSVARFHCVSKLWESIFSGAYFRELFLTRSSAQPRILFAIVKEGLWSIFSVPQRHRPYENSSSSSLVVAAEFHMTFPPENMVIDRHDGRIEFSYASGLMYFYGMRMKEETRGRLPVICNPKTGRFTTLPFYFGYRRAHNFIGFDPINKQFKVLLMNYSFLPRRYHTVMTLGTGKLRWRRIICSLRHKVLSGGICINGVLYYLGEKCEVNVVDDDTSEDDDEKSNYVIVCFNVRSETFKFIYPEGFCQLINYKGKLGVIHYYYVDDAIELLVWVLEDFKKQEWSKYEYALRDDKFLPYHVSVVGVTATGEIVLSMADYTSEQPFYVFYFNPERKSLQCVEIQGFEEYHEALDKPSRVHVFVDDCSRFYAFADQEEDLIVKHPKLLKSSIYAPYVKTEEVLGEEDWSGSEDEYDSEYEDVDKYEVGDEYDYDYDYDYDYGYEYEDEAEFDHSIWQL